MRTVSDHSGRDRNGLVVLDRQACLERLAQRRIGTIALTDGALPIAVPALYALSDQSIVLSADATSLLGRRLPEAIVSLCVHDIPEDLANGWSITVTGQAITVPDPSRRLLADTLDALPAWGDGDDDAIVALLGTERISGRELPPGWRQGRRRT